VTAIVESRQADRIETIRGACVTGDGIDPLDEATTLRLRNHGLGTDDRLWLHGDDGFLLAFAEHSDRSPRLDLTLAVRPDSRLRGTATSLLDACLENADASAECFAWSHGDHPAAAALAESTGFDRARALWVMRRAVDRSGWTSPRAPRPGVTIRSYQPDDAADLIAINAAAFADHPEQGTMDAANLAERMAEPWFDPDGLFIAVDEHHEMLGFHWTKLDPSTHEKTGKLIGEVYVIAVSPAAHGQGVGRSLMDAGLDHLAHRGSGQVILYVEATNAPALAMYESLGFTHADRDTHVLYRRPADLAASR
jgi:mycothiol synthase